MLYLVEQNNFHLNSQLSDNLREWGSTFAISIILIIKILIIMEITMKFLSESFLSL